MKPRTRPPKMVGEWVELEFMARAARHGLTISKPYGDSAPFDFVVGRRTPLHRVQVRGTSIYTNARSYICRVTRGNPPVRYRRFDFDFLAVFAIPQEQWYIIPMAAIPRTRNAISLYPHIRHSRGRLEKYRDAWHLLVSMGNARRRRAP
ncbi:MAG TPA: group I intron-associated PD-(D/E)XK endonuclease [Terriglobales bacterium]|nr:group I intron-associated PD-(D/E)XK endonuclease [Terriglobales bacterium]